ncbi:MAG: thioredoxin family protein [Elusimicrobiota bacterium]
MVRTKVVWYIFTLTIILMITGCDKDKSDIKATNETPVVENSTPEMKKVVTAPAAQTVPVQEKKAVQGRILATFIELGSINCVPCKMMAPIVKELEEEYKGKVNVIFYDVWTDEGKPYAMKYGIQAIPTQVFLDKDGNEYFRHTGFFPKEEILKTLAMKGIK